MHSIAACVQCLTILLRSFPAGASFTILACVPSPSCCPVSAPTIPCHAIPASPVPSPRLIVRLASRLAPLHLTSSHRIAPTAPLHFIVPPTPHPHPPDWPCSLSAGSRRLSGAVLRASGSLGVAGMRATGAIGEAGMRAATTAASGLRVSHAGGTRHSISGRCGHSSEFLPPRLPDFEVGHHNADSLLPVPQRRSPGLSRPSYPELASANDAGPSSPTVSDWSRTHAIGCCLLPHICLRCHATLAPASRDSGPRVSHC